MTSSSSSRGLPWTPPRQAGRGRQASRARWRSPAHLAARWARRPSGRRHLVWWAASSRWWPPCPLGGCRRWGRTTPVWVRTAGEAVTPRGVTPPTSQTRRRWGAAAARPATRWRGPVTTCPATPRPAGRWGRPGSRRPPQTGAGTPWVTATPVVGVSLPPTDHRLSQRVWGTAVLPVTPRHTETPHLLQAARPRGLQDPLTTLPHLNTGTWGGTREPRQAGASLVTTPESPRHEDSPGCGRPDTPATPLTRYDHPLVCWSDGQYFSRNNFHARLKYIEIFSFVNNK